MIAKTLLAGVATILFALAIQNANAEYNVAKYCQTVPSGTKLPSLESCQTYYTCNFDGSVAAENCPSTQSFNKNTQSCQASSAVDCYYGLANPCQNKNYEYVPTVDNCRGWIWCVNSVEIGRDNCPLNEIFDPTISECVYGTCDNVDAVGIQANDVQNVCQIMQNGAWFGSFDSCAKWNKCNNLELQSGYCENDLVYNTQQQMCLRNDGTMCARTNGAAPSAPTEACNPSILNKLQGDSSVCSTYYKCDGVKWQQLQCKTGQYFDVNSSVCKTRQYATPKTGCNRCEFSNSPWVNAVDPDCQEYLICKNGFEAGKGSCDENQFFSEQRQGCVVGTSSLNSYALNNGACAPDPVTEMPTTHDPTTEAPTTKDSPTEPPTTKDPPTEPPTTKDPPTEPPTTKDPPTEPPTTIDPPTEPPTTKDPPTEPPTTKDPPTEPPTTKDPPTEPPTTKDPTANQP